MLPAFIAPTGTNPGFPAFIRLVAEPIAPTVFNLYAYLDLAGTDAATLAIAGPTLQTSVYVATISVSGAFASRCEVSVFAAIADLIPTLPTLTVEAPLSPTLDVQQIAPELTVAATMGAAKLTGRSPALETAVSVPTAELNYEHPRDDPAC